VLSHQFLYSLLRSYGFELHHLTPSGILHMAAFVALCEANIGIEPHLSMWSHFFWARLRWGSDTRAASLGSMDILVRFGPEADSYFSIPLANPPVEWWKAWFLQKNDTNALLPMFTGGLPIPYTNRDCGVALTNLHRLQPLLKIIQGLLHKGLMGEETLRTFFSRDVQSLR
jgi:hypothetical protein